MKKNFNKLKNKTNLIAIVLVIVSIGILFCVQETKPKVVKAYNNDFISIPEEKNWAFTKKKIIINDKKVKRVYCTTTNIKIAYCKNNYLYIKKPGKVTLNFYTKNNNKKLKKTIKVEHSPLINFTKRNMIIENKETYKLKLKTRGYPIKNIKFSSNHPETISVDKNGVITAHSPSNALITASTLDGRKTSIRVIVKTTKGLISRTMLDRAGAYKYKKLMVVAHPDDETLWGGANLYKDSYFVVCLTNGKNPVRSKEYKNILKFTNNGGLILNYPDDPDGVRDEWNYAKKGLNLDMQRLITYKKWDAVVTYNPDGVTGHIHHKKTFQHVYKVCDKYKMLDRLYYFGHFYKKGEVPNTLIRMSDEDLAIKMEEIKLYSSVRNNIHNYWEQMLPYENWIPALKWNEYPR